MISDIQQNKQLNYIKASKTPNIVFYVHDMAVQVIINPYISLQSMGLLCLISNLPYRTDLTKSCIQSTFNEPCLKSLLKIRSQKKNKFYRQNYTEQFLYRV